MQIKNIFSFFVVLASAITLWADVPQHLFLTEPPPVQLPLSARVFVDMETLSNPAVVRSNQPFWIEHLEIPLNMLTEDMGKGLDPKVRESLVFMKNGIPHVRWLLNPEDTQYGEEVIKKMAEQGVTVTKGRHFIGYLTSSRSCVVQDPKSGFVFSIKSSTNVTGGNWRDKKETVRASQAARLMSDYLVDNFTNTENTTLRIIKEPLSYALNSVDQAIIVRQYDHFNSPTQDRILIPAFSAAHSEKGQEIATRNGAANAADFWKKYLAGDLGRSLAEMVMNFGIIYNSPHGQNFMIEVDPNMKPTGKVYAKDYADAHIQKQIMEARGGQAIVELYKTFKSNTTYSSGQIYAMANPYYSGHVNKPTWLADENTWKNEFINEFADRTKALLTAKVGPVNFSRASFSDTYVGHYWGWQANLTDGKIMEQWSQALRRRGGAPLCRMVFLPAG